MGVRNSWLVLATVLVVGVGCKTEPGPGTPPEVGPGPIQNCEDAPPSCEELERNCGPVTDACGRVVECGTCSATQTCGGGGTAGLCGGRTCEADCPAGYTCRGDGTCANGPRDALALDAKTFEVEGQFLHEGAPVTNCSSYFYRLGFTDLQSGVEYEVKLDCSLETGWTFKSHLPPGAYRFALHWSSASSGDFVRRQFASFLSVQSDRKGLLFEVSAPQVAVAGRIVVNGPPLPWTGTPAKLRFVELRTDVTTLLPLDVVGRFQGRLPPGGHLVTLEGGGAPTGADALVGTLQADTSQEEVELTLAPNSLEVVGRITRDGQELRDDTCYGHGSRQTFAHFVDVTGQRTFSFQVHCWQQENGWRFEGRLPPGSYRVELEPRDYGPRGTLGSLPQGRVVALPRLELLESQRELVLDVKTQAVSGSIVQGGTALPAGLCSDANSTTDAFGNHTYVELSDMDTGVVTRLGVACSSNAGWTFQGRVLPGRYGMSILPRDTAGTGEASYPNVKGFAAPLTLEVSGDRQGIVLDITRHEVAGRIQLHAVDSISTCRLDGQTQLWFVHPRTRREQRLDLQCDSENSGTFHGAVFPGTYELLIFNGQSNPSANMPPLKVAGPRTDLVLSSASNASRVSGTLTRNGQQLGLTDACDHVVRWTNSPWLWRYVTQYIVLVSTEDGSRWRLPIRCGDATTASEVWTFSGRVPPGTYRVQLELNLDRPREGTDPATLLYRLPGLRHVLIPTLELSGGE